MSPRFTVAMCTHNHADRLERTLADFAQIAAPSAPWELLIVDNGSTDATAALLAAHRWPAGWAVRIVHEPRLGLSNARNRAIAEAQGDYVIFMDDDETADPGWLRAYETLIDERQPDAFGGRIAVLFEGARPAWLTDELLGFLGELNMFPDPRPLVDRSTSFYGGNFGFRRTLVEAIGPFSTELGRKGADNTGGEETDFYRRALAAGHSVWWTPHAIIHHRIQAEKLRPAYFRDLHFRQGRMEAARDRDNRRGAPPLYLYGQLARALLAVARVAFAEGAVKTVRQQMNVFYFMGRMTGCVLGARR